MAVPSQKESRFLGIPVGRFGLFSTLLLILASGCFVFFLVATLAIFVLLFLNSTGHPVDYTLSYRAIALPAGLLAMTLAFCLLFPQWLRRRLTGGRPQTYDTH